MPTQIVSTQAASDIALAAQKVIEKRPMLEPIVRSFAEILSAKSEVVNQLRVNTVQLDPLLRPERLLQGVPLLADVSLGILDEPLQEAFRAILPVLKKTFGSIAADLTSLESLQSRNELDLFELSRAYLGGEISVLHSFAQATHISEIVLALALNTTLSSLLTALEPTVRNYVSELHWYRGYCPICGSMPSISYLAEAHDLGSEFLRGGGGQRYLHCSLCGHDWRFMRNKCPACETEDRDLQLYFQAQEDHSERVDVCCNCNAYLPCIDLREGHVKLPMDMAAISMVHLDAWASEKGYHPLVQTPWNLIR